MFIGIKGLPLHCTPSAFGRCGYPPMPEITKTKTMALSKDIKSTLVASTQAAQQSTFSTLDTVSLGELMKQGQFTTVSKVFLTRENKFKALVFRKDDGSSACVLFGKNSANQVNVGDAPKKSWSIVLATNADGEQRLRVSLGVETLTADELED